MFKWLTESNRWKHFVLAICIGLWATISLEIIYRLFKLDNIIFNNALL